MAKNKTAKTKAKSKKHLVEQGEYEVGDKKPPKEHQFKPGQSGNPNGPPIHRCNLWVWITKYMELTDAEFAKLDRDKLTQAQQTALRLVEDAKNGKETGSERLARYIVDRDEGRAVQSVKGDFDVRETITAQRLAQIGLTDD